ncbi:AAA family ATPase [Geobacter sp.]|uniref:ExeA family protein n=1 Tax=Geobacter sp. TaxID=46610 RepID=UPI0026220589|nr:AAA family ATPase [Geobacter sp.]
MTAKAYQMEFEPITLKGLVHACGISQAELARAVAEIIGQDISRPTINLCINRGYIPLTIDRFKPAVEDVIRANPAALQWLLDHELSVGDIWTPLGDERRKHKPADHGKRSIAGRKRSALIPGNPDVITIQWEVEMISQEALRHFKLFRNPFIDDIQKDGDIYMSDEHRYIEAAMLDAARHGGFLAVIGEVGSGKSVMRRKIVEQLRKDGDVLVIYPQMIDKGRLSAGSICDAIIQDVSSEKCKAKLEDKTRQVQRLLLDRAKSGYRACLIIEEAHDLNVQTLKYLKRFYELEDGYRKLLGIVLIGQTELKHMFNEAQNVDMREVIRRVQVAEIKGLNGHLRDYLVTKFKRLGKNVDEIFADDAFEALSRRLTATDRDGKTKVSHAYPLLVNNHTARAMNLTYEMGEARVTAEVVEAI